MLISNTFLCLFKGAKMTVDTADRPHTAQCAAALGSFGPGFPRKYRTENPWEGVGYGTEFYAFRKAPMMNGALRT